MKLFIGNLDVSLTENDIRSTFETFGQVKSVYIVRDNTGSSKGYGFVEYFDANKAKLASEDLNGFELAGRALQVTRVMMVESESEPDDDEGDCNIEAAVGSLAISKKP